MQLLNIIIIIHSISILLNLIFLPFQRRITLGWALQWILLSLVPIASTIFMVLNIGETTWFKSLMNFKLKG